MGALLSRRPVPGARPGLWPPLPAPWTPAGGTGLGIALGSAVRVSLYGGWAQADATGASMTEEGVVIEVVSPGCSPRSARVEPGRPARSPACRYVVQCWTCRVLRRSADIILVSP